MPAEMFREEPQSGTLRLMEEEFRSTRRDLQVDALGRPAVDGGSFGAYIDTNSEFHADEIKSDRLATKDPLWGHPVLQKVRDSFMSQQDLNVEPSFEQGTPIHQISDYQRHADAVQKYLFFKKVNETLIVCALHYSSTSENGDILYDWVSFALECPDDGLPVRSDLVKVVMDILSQ